VTALHELTLASFQEIRFVFARTDEMLEDCEQRFDGSMQNVERGGRVVIAVASDDLAHSLKDPKST
jgi:hypothetical protein